MKKLALSSVIILSTLSITFSQVIPTDSLYFGQTPPGCIPQLFAPGIVSIPDRNEATITFSPDGASVFFHIEKYPEPGNPYIMSASYLEDHWTTPDTIPFSNGRATGEPFFAYNGNRVYLFATNAVNHEGIADLSFSQKEGDSWSDPVSLGNPPNSESYQYHPCIVGDSSVYFSSQAGKICRSQYCDGIYENRIVLPKPVNFIGSQTWGDPYVSADESYMIMKAIREEGYGQNDLYIAYRKPDGNWTNPKNLGNVINTPGDETSGDITPDGLYMTYGSNDDLYWVSAGFTDSLRYTNFIPYMKYPIPDQTAYIGEQFIYSIPDSTFFDDDSSSVFTFTAVLTNGNPLPEWLTFDTVSGVFTGVPEMEQILNIKLTANDNAGASAWTPFKLSVQLPTGYDPVNFHALTIFPNPNRGLITITLGPFTGKTATVVLNDLQGRSFVRQVFKNETIIDLTDCSSGVYILKVYVENELISRKIYKM